MRSRINLLAKTFGTDEQGSVAMIFGLMSISLLFMAGMAVDYNRITNMRQRVADAVDSASLAAGKALLEGKLTDSEIEDLAKIYFTENVKNAKRIGTVDAPSVKVDREKGSVTIDVNSSVPMTLTRLGGFQNIDVPVSSAAVFQQKDIEVGMALDITGSMLQFQGGQSKISALKTAFANFADRLIPEQPNPAQRVRIGVAPYSASINLGDFAAVASEGRSNDGCVVERKAGNFSDATDPFFVKQDGVSKNYVCPNGKLVPLSDNKDTLVSYVNSFNASGSTAGHIGVQWAWNIVSDKWGGAWGGDSVPDSYAQVDKGKLLKAVVLMTDGEFNTQHHGQQSSKQAVALCDAMKAKGVTVFSVGFGLGGDQNAIKTLQSCANDGDDYFADANTPAELDAAFQKFAAKLTELRLAK